ncbi:MAG: sensor histidine kinase [Rickettsiaceae bacterium]
MIQNKHIIQLSFIGLLITILANIMLYRYFVIEEVILKKTSSTNQRFANLSISSIWNKHQNVIKKINDTALKNLLTDQDFIDFIKEASESIKNTDSNITIYNKNGYKILSNTNNHGEQNFQRAHLTIINKIILKIDRYFLKDYLSDNPIQLAYHGRAAHSLKIKSIATDDLYDREIDKIFIIGYFPIINTGGDFAISGMVEIAQDITEQWYNISYLAKNMTQTSLIVFSLFYIIVLYNTNYAQKIINKQLETNRELANAKTKAETESSAKTEFLANIRHELRTPLSSIIGFSDLILSEAHGKIGDIRYKEYIFDINVSGQHLLEIINDILDFSKASANKLPTDKIELDLNKIIALSMRIVKPRADQASIKLIKQIPNEHIIIVADPKRLKQVLLNLLSNAIKFTPKNGLVTISLEVNIIKKLVYLSVKDTGIGISDQDIPKALSLFGQINNKLNRKHDGTGIGLPLSKTLVELMNGTFNLESNVKRGTKVIITFEYKGIIDV